MKYFLRFSILLLLALCLSLGLGGQDITAQNSLLKPTKLHLTYPPKQHQTTSNKIFLIGTAPPTDEVTVNGKPIDRIPAGHFAPSFPLQIGKNNFALKYQNQSINLVVTRLESEPKPPTQLGFLVDSLIPNVDIAQKTNDRICFGAIATPNATVKVKLGDRSIALNPKQRNIQLPPNTSILTKSNQPIDALIAGHYEGCTTFSTSGKIGKPEYSVALGNRNIKQTAKGSIEILSPDRIQTAEVIDEVAVARTGPSSDFSRLTPLPKGAIDTIEAKQGDWLRLSYGGWIPAKSAKLGNANLPPRSIVKSLSTRKISGWTEVIIPLEVAVPISVSQVDRTFILTLHNVTAQTDTILVTGDPAIDRFDWQQTAPSKVEYKISLKPSQQWGYKLEYRGTSLVLSLRHPPLTQGRSSNSNLPLQGVKILLDPGHGSSNDYGSRGPTGYAEKDVTLITSKLLREHLQRQGANVILTREGDDDLYPNDRVKLIEKIEPSIAISIHYNALPDHGNAIDTKGIGTFWYHNQAQPLAIFLHDYLTKNLNRNAYGVYWNNLALARPTIAPSVLLELGFMINPTEFEWVINPDAQKKLALTLSDGITKWLIDSTS